MDPRLVPVPVDDDLMDASIIKRITHRYINRSLLDHSCLKEKLNCWRDSRRGMNRDSSGKGVVYNRVMGIKGKNEKIKKINKKYRTTRFLQKVNERRTGRAGPAENLSRRIERF